MLKILQARLQQYMNQELPDIQLDLEKAEEPEIKLPTSIESYKKQDNPPSKSTSPFSSVQSLSRVRLLVTPWTAAYQAPLSMGFSRQEYWSGVPLLACEMSAIVQ